MRERVSCWILTSPEGPLSTERERGDARVGRWGVGGDRDRVSSWIIISLHGPLNAERVRQTQRDRQTEGQREGRDRDSETQS